MAPPEGILRTRVHSPGERTSGRRPRGARPGWTAPGGGAARVKGNCRAAGGMGTLKPLAGRAVGVRDVWILRVVRPRSREEPTVRRGAGAYATMGRGWSPGRSTGRTTARWIWPPGWGWSSSPNTSIGRSRSWGSSTRRPPAGSGHPPPSGSWAEPCSVIDATAPCSSTTTERSRTTPPGDSGVAPSLNPDVPFLPRRLNDRRSDDRRTAAPPPTRGTPAYAE